ncbi:Uncharacterised protein [Mycobacteroides abscessus subsp. abscessus]|uniref:hypothetical protein n=1 Tax=Mycobacteroides abscessus TaxID=36809 RepID=UPI00092703E5|nr:hypothetical protein [Mycobacteroides abscessus]SIH24419.1 Uncharacterised protein [Mycobacteroides abscessus subsp. abscessus]
MGSPSDLAAILERVDEHEYVRFTAHWLTDAQDLDEEPALTGNSVIDALVAAASALLGMRRLGQEPAWTTHESRALRTRLWHPGNPNMLAYSLVRAPASFIVRGVVVDEESLVSI